MTIAELTLSPVPWWIATAVVYRVVVAIGERRGWIPPENEAGPDAEASRPNAHRSRKARP